MVRPVPCSYLNKNCSDFVFRSRWTILSPAFPQTRKPNISQGKLNMPIGSHSFLSRKTTIDGWSQALTCNVESKMRTIWLIDRRHLFRGILSSLNNQPWRCVDKYNHGTIVSSFQRGHSIPWTLFLFLKYTSRQTPSRVGPMRWHFAKGRIDFP